MHDTFSDKLELMAGALRIQQRHALRLGLHNLHHLLGVAEMEIQDVLCELAAETGAAASCRGDVIPFFK